MDDVGCLDDVAARATGATDSASNPGDHGAHIERDLDALVVLAIFHRTLAK
jgi:hypothetical protein